ncbi:tetratricopeptide repeat protein [Sphingomonas sp. UYP23]
MRKTISSRLASLAAIGTAGLLVAGCHAPARVDPAAARTELALSVKALGIGNYSAARNHAQSAIKADPRSGLAHALLARSYLSVGDGIAAEGELGRARALGFDSARTHHLLAQAWLLQGHADRALAEAAKAPPRYTGYAIRIGARALAAQGDPARAQAVLAALLSSTPTDSFAWSDLGRIQYQTGNIAGAITAATRATAANADNVEALTLRGELVRTQYGLVAALPWFEAALAHDAYYVPALIEYSATLGEVGRYQDMLAATRKALAARPGNAQALYLQAVLAARAGKDDLARQLMARTKTKLDALPGALLLNGALAYRAGVYQQAIDAWSLLVGQQPTNIEARRLLGAALLRSGDARGALDILKPVALRADADSYTLSLVGRAFEQAGERDWAAKYLDRSAIPVVAGSAPLGTDDGLAGLSLAAREAPNEPVAQLALVRGLLEAGDTAAALSKAQGLVTLTPGAPDAYLALGDTLMALTRYGDAAGAYRHAIDIRFDEPTMLRTVDALDRAGRASEAANVLALFVSQNPQNIAGQRLAAHWQIAGGDWEAAIETLERLRLRIGNRDAALLAELSYAYTGAGDADAGHIFGKAAYALAPMNPATTDAYGWALYQQGKSAPALQLLEKAASIAPDRSALRWHLGQAYADLDRGAEAKTQIRAALADPRFGDRAAAQAALKALG